MNKNSFPTLSLMNGKAFQRFCEIVACFVYRPFSILIFSFVIKRIIYSKMDFRQIPSIEDN